MTSSSSINEVSFQLMSDLHLEFPNVWNNFPAMEAVAPILVLCGDIGKPDTPAYRYFLEKFSPRFQLILVIAGNHEYYGLEYHSAQAALESLCSSFPNVLLMQKRAIIINDTWRVIGTTLWSHIPAENVFDVTVSLNDYNYISIRDQPDSSVKRKITVADTEAWFQDELQFLKSQIEKAKQHQDQKVVVLTHHAPLLTGTSHPRYNGSPINCAFSTDLRPLLTPPVVSWFFGHTHYSSEQYSTEGTQVLSNQLGYQHEQPNFSPNTVVIPGRNPFVLSVLPPETPRITWREADDCSQLSSLL